VRKCGVLHRSTALLLLLLAAGCTATKASIQIVSAEDNLRRARDYDADELAAYEYTMAIRYLEKAREEAGHSEFRIADALARQSAVWSDRAIIFVESRGRSDLRLEDFEEGVAPQGPPPEEEAAPAPASVPTGLEDILGPTPPAPAPPANPQPLDDLLGPLPGEEEP
jgi:hypothetical protein